MTKPDFLGKLIEEGKLGLVEPSDQISKSYLVKSENCRISANAVFDAGIYENAVSEAYYSMYNSVMALFFKCGIKCESHSAAVILVKRLFSLDDEYKVFSEMKKDRIDNQYYVLQSSETTKEVCAQRLKTAVIFNSSLRLCIQKLNLEDIDDIRKKFKQI